MQFYAGSQCCPTLLLQLCLLVVVATTLKPCCRRTSASQTVLAISSELKRNFTELFRGLQATRVQVVDRVRDMKLLHFSSFFVSMDIQVRLEMIKRRRKVSFISSFFSIHGLLLVKSGGGVRNVGSMNFLIKYQWKISSYRYWVLFGTKMTTANTMMLVMVQTSLAIKSTQVKTSLMESTTKALG